MSGMTPRARALTIGAVAIPVLGIALGIARSELQFARSQDWSLPVAGYDPVDLLRGHYIQYQVQLPGAQFGSCYDTEPDCCLCLARGEPVAISREPCSVAKSCDGMLRTEYLPQLQRYYVPEARAQEAENQLRLAAGQGKAELVVAIDPSGKPQVRALLIDGKPLLP